MHKVDKEKKKIAREFLEERKKYIEDRYVSSHSFRMAELHNVLTDYVPTKKFKIVREGVENTSDNDPVKKHSGHVTLYFRKEDDSVVADLGGHTGIQIPFSPRKYGFDNDRTVKLSPRPYELNLTPEARVMYDDILKKKEIPLNDLLEKIGFIVNSSMAYDFDAIKAAESKPGRVKTKDWDVEKKKFPEETNKPMKGYCHHAGTHIRNMLHHLGLEQKIGYTHNTAGGETDHDTTIVFDKETGEWAVINSKSPYKKFNLASKDQLKELGKTYAHVAKYEKE